MSNESSMSDEGVISGAAAPYEPQEKNTANASERRHQTSSGLIK